MVIGDLGPVLLLPRILHDHVPAVQMCGDLVGLLAPRPVRSLTQRREARPEARQEKGHESDLDRHIVILHTAMGRK